jgi:hypothetical protein
LNYYYYTIYIILLLILNPRSETEFYVGNRFFAFVPVACKILRAGTFCPYSVCPRVVTRVLVLKGGVGEPLFSVGKFVCPRVVTRVLVLKGGVGEPLFSVRQFVCPRVARVLVLKGGVGEPLFSVRGL